MLDSLKNKNKYGFSLFEVVVTMGIIAIFIAACSNVFTQRHKKRITTPVHGRFECYRDASGKVHQRLFNETVLASEQTFGNGANVRCTFRPPSHASYIMINAVGGGGRGGSQYGGSSGSYTSVFLSTTTHILEMNPGLAAQNTSSRGGNTKIFDKGENGTSPDKTIVNLRGGKSDSGSNLTFKDCTIATQAFSCGVDPSCTIKEPEGSSDGALEVTYCSYQSDQGNEGLVDAGDSAVKTVSIPYKTSLPDGDSQYDDLCSITPSFRAANQRIQSVLDAYGGSSADLAAMSKGVVTYTYAKKQCKDPTTEADAVAITYFKINVSIDGNYTTEPDPSPLNGYVNSLNINDGIATTTGSGVNKRGVSTGDGGARNQAGGHGAVLVTW